MKLHHWSHKPEKLVGGENEPFWTIENGGVSSYLSDHEPRDRLWESLDSSCTERRPHISYSQQLTYILIKTPGRKQSLIKQRGNMWKD